ncbi:MAG TPA: hypothetical protein VE825_06255 [Terriglobales bacterium]|jgi:hypothetical protein|nr:hypothetical protein [Terriglobales bacterium]
MRLAGTVLRVAAFACLLASAPISLLMYPWLPAAAMEFVELQRDPAPGATLSYYDSREHQRQRAEAALLLYALGTVALVGLGAIAAKLLPWWAEMAGWTLTAVAGFEVARFLRPLVGPRTDPAFVFMTMTMPLSVAVVAAAAACLTLTLRVARSPAAR